MKTFLILMMVLLIGCTTISPDGTVMRDATGNAWASLLLPGAGQFYNKENGKGLLYLGLATTSYISWMNSEKQLSIGHTLLLTGITHGCTVWVQ